MDNFNWLGTLCIVGMIFGIGVLTVLILAPGFLLGFAIAKSVNKELNAEREERRKFQQSIWNNGGVMASGVVIAANVIKSWGGGKNRSADSYSMEYLVEITPDGGEPYRTKISHEYSGGSRTVVLNEMVSEHGRKVWVVFDPNDPTRAYLDHYDDDHEEGIVNYRRGKFNKLTEGNEELKRTGVQAEAIITGVEDLNLPYPLKNGRAMRLSFDVMPRGGTVFRAEAYVLIANTAHEKYSAGKMVYVRFDPTRPERAVLDSEQNKMIK
ncbi:MAG TPA: hypothetical protein PK989_13320 [Anaerolineales bacterium]|nr:hypothetical protein [Anaerolineales bacterium]